MNRIFLYFNLFHPVNLVNPVQICFYRKRPEVEIGKGLPKTAQGGKRHAAWLQAAGGFTVFAEGGEALRVVKLDFTVAERPGLGTELFDLKRGPGKET